MATAFSENESILIKQKLKASAKECLLRYGVRKTSVDQLVADAAISKGSFYKFYSSKELLFWEVINDIHNEIYKLAENILLNHSKLAPVDRITETLITCFNYLYQYVSQDFMENEIDYLLRKLPPDAIDVHLASEGTEILRLIKLSGFKFNQPPEVIAGIIHTLIFTTDHRQRIGSNYDLILRLIIKGTFNELLVQ